MSDELGFRDRGIPRGDAFTQGEIEQWREETENILASVPAAETQEDRTQTAVWLREQVMTLFYDQRLEFVCAGQVIRGSATPGQNDEDFATQHDWERLQHCVNRGLQIEVESQTGQGDLTSSIEETVNLAVVLAGKLSQAG